MGYDQYRITITYKIIDEIPLCTYLTCKSITVVRLAQTAERITHSTGLQL
jgi:hypothetical protein